MKKLISAVALVGVSLLPVTGYCFDHPRDYRPDYRPPHHHHYHHNRHRDRDVLLGLGAVGIIAGTAMAMSQPSTYREERVNQMCRYKEPVYDRYGYVIRTRVVERPFQY